MRTADLTEQTFYSYRTLDDRIPAEQPLRKRLGWVSLTLYPAYVLPTMQQNARQRRSAPTASFEDSEMNAPLAYPRLSIAARIPAFRRKVSLANWWS